MKKLDSYCFYNTSLRILSIFIAITVIGLLSPSGAGAQDNRSFHFPSVLIEAEIGPDGSMTVREERTYRFQGRFSGGYGKIYQKHNTLVRDVQVSENGVQYRPAPVGTVGIPGIFFVEYNPDHVYVDWSFEAYNEDRTFTITYLVENAVLVHEDVAELYWQFIGDESDQPVDYTRVNLSLPPGAGEGDIRAWAHGPLHGEIRIDSPSTVTWEINTLPKKTFLEGRVAFPRHLVPQATIFSGREGLPGMLADETKWARKANQERTLGRADFILAPLLMLGLPLYFVLAVFRSRRSPGAFKGDYYRELPGDYSPAEAGFLARLGKTAPEDFTATVLDLARRGHLKLEEYEGESGRLIKRKFRDFRIIPEEGKDYLKSHEQKLFSFIFENVAGGSPEGTTLRDIQDYGRRQKSITANFYSNWNQDIKQAIEKYKFFRGPAWPQVIAGGILTFVGILLIIAGMLFAGLAAVIIGPVFAVGFVLIKRLTPTGADHLAKWRAFKRFLQHFSELDRSQIPALAVWEHYLVYAVSLNAAREVMQQLHLVYPDLQSESYRAWPAAYGLAFNSPAGFNSLNSAMQQSFQSVFRSAASSGSGGGGGFSGGGGGGGGGGGFGAR